MAEIVLTNASVEVNDEPQVIMANTVSVILGGGESDIKGGSKGGAVIPIFSENIETKIGEVKYESPSTETTVENIKAYKDNGPANVVRVTGVGPAGARVNLTFKTAALVNQPEIAFQSEGTASFEWKSQPAIIG